MEPGVEQRVKARVKVDGQEQGTETETREEAMIKYGEGETQGLGAVVAARQGEDQDRSRVEPGIGLDVDNRRQVKSRV